MNDPEMLPGDRAIMNMRVTALSVLTLLVLTAAGAVALFLMLR